MIVAFGSSFLKKPFGLRGWLSLFIFFDQLWKTVLFGRFDGLAVHEIIQICIDHPSLMFLRFLPATVWYMELGLMGLAFLLVYKGPSIKVLRATVAPYPDGSWQEKVKRLMCAEWIFCEISLIAVVLIHSLFFSDGLHHYVVHYGHLGSKYSLISTVIIAPILEEILYRYIFLRLLLRIVPIPAALFITAVLFGLRHPAVLPQLIGGFFLGIAYLRTGRLWIPMVMHALWNSWMVIENKLWGLIADIFGRESIWYGGHLFQILIVLLGLQFALRVFREERTELLGQPLKIPEAGGVAGRDLSLESTL